MRHRVGATGAAEHYGSQRKICAAAYARAKHGVESITKRLAKLRAVSLQQRRLLLRNWPRKKHRGYKRAVEAVRVVPESSLSARRRAGRFTRAERGSLQLSIKGQTATTRRLSKEWVAHGARGD